MDKHDPGPAGLALPPNQARNKKTWIPADRLRGILSLLLKLSAILPVFFAILTVFTMEDGDSPGLFLLILCAGGIAALLLFSAGELMRILSEISANTRKSPEQRLNRY